MELKDKVIEYRAKHGIKLHEMAKLCGVSVTTILHIEKGYGKPNMVTVCKVQKVVDGEIAK